MDCQDLLATSPAFLLELLDIFSFLACWLCTLGATCIPMATAEESKKKGAGSNYLPAAVCDYQFLVSGRQGGAGRHWIER
jgi:hypothetical protein